jgi:hypothetical protein
LQSCLHSQPSIAACTITACNKQRKATSHELMKELVQQEQLHLDLAWCIHSFPHVNTTN